MMATSAKDVSLVLREARAEAAAPWWALALRLKHLFGVDRAIAYTVLARVVQILGSTGTVLLILRFLTPVEQGYYYTLLSLVSLQVVFELGFSFVILQMAAHECAHLTVHTDGRIEGDPTAHARLASLLQKTFRWYLAAAVILYVSLLPAGAFFFSRHAHTTIPLATGPVAWHGPWVVAVLATAVLFLLNPFFSFLEGCGQVWQVGRIRFGQALLGAVMSWGALLAHHGLYSPAMVIIGHVAAGMAFLYSRRNLCLGLLRYPARERAVSWRSEVWPFQWKIAVSWLCSYFTIQIFTPVLFAYRGPAEAGQFGMSLSVTGYLSALVLAWMSTKATPFGQMIARLAARMVSPQIFLLLLLTCVSAFVVQSMAIYLRSFKREPFLIQSMVIAALSILLSLLTVRAFGTTGIALSYFLCTGIVGMIFGATIFRSWHGAAEGTLLAGG